MNRVLPSGLLKNALAADALVSGAVALLQVSMPDALGRLLMLPRGLLLETGIFLAVYTVLLIVLAASRRIWSSVIAIVVLGNLGWAAGCVFLLASGHLQPGAIGQVFVFVQAAAVLIFAALEYRGLKDSARVGSPTPVRI